MVESTRADTIVEALMAAAGRTLNIGIARLEDALREVCIEATSGKSSASHIVGRGRLDFTAGSLWAVEV